VHAFLFVACGYRTSGAAIRKQHNLAIQGWRPVSNTVTQVTEVQRAKFAAIDVHTHLSRGHNPAEVIKLMDAANLRTVVHVTGGFGDQLREVIGKLNAHPGRFIVCTTPDWRNINAPDFTSKAVQYLEDAKRAGAQCLKVTKVLGLYLKDTSGKFVAVNDARMDPIWRKCGELGLPVLIHTADPIAFFRPWDEKNETYSALWRQPDWWFHGPDHTGTPRFTHDELMRQRDDIVARHPKTTFVALHYGSLSHDLGAVGRLLDRFPNVMVEMGARNWALGTVPNSGRKFAMKNQDRILFGTDGAVTDHNLYRQYFRTLETDDDYIVNVLPRPWGPIHGVHLSDDVLRKIYFENALKLFRKYGGL
jgi:uncharacterized protein